MTIIKIRKDNNMMITVPLVPKNTWCDEDFDLPDVLYFKVAGCFGSVCVRKMFIVILLVMKHE